MKQEDLGGMDVRTSIAESAWRFGRSCPGRENSFLFITGPCKCWKSATWESGLQRSRL